MFQWYGICCTNGQVFCKAMVITWFPKVQRTSGGVMGPVDLHMKTASSPSLTRRLLGDTVTVIGVAENIHRIHVSTSVSVK